MAESEDAVDRSAWTLSVGSRAELRIEQFGDRADPVILLISGAGAPAAFWPDFFCEALALEGYRVVRFDHRDTGFSTHFDDPYDISTLTGDVESIIDALDANEVHVVGHSMGGYIVSLLASERSRPEVMSATVIAAGPTSDTSRYGEFAMSTPTQETWAALIGNEPTGELQNDLPGWLKSWRILNGLRAFEQDLAEAYTRALYQGDPRNAQVATNHIHAMTTVPNNLPEALGNIDIPFLVVHGSEDVLVPLDNGRALARLVPGSVLHIIQGAGHMYFTHETWSELAAIISDLATET